MPVPSYWPVLAPVVSAPTAFAAPPLEEDDFLVELQNLLPPGRAWRRDPDANLTAFLRGFAASQAKTHARKLDLLVDAFPATTVELLPEWEASVGLPDPCAGPDPSLLLRQAHLLARLKNQGGQSIPYLVAYAASLGFIITITPYTALKFGRKFGQPMLGPAWANAILIHAASETVTQAKFGRSHFGDPFASWGNAVLECEMRRIAPGHLFLIFSYSG